MVVEDIHEVLSRREHVHQKAGLRFAWKETFRWASYRRYCSCGVGRTLYRIRNMAWTSIPVSYLVSCTSYSRTDRCMPLNRDAAIPPPRVRVYEYEASQRGRSRQERLHGSRPVAGVSHFHRSGPETSGASPRGRCWLRLRRGVRLQVVSKRRPFSSQKNRATRASDHHTCWQYKTCLYVCAFRCDKKW